MRRLSNVEQPEAEPEKDPLAKLRSDGLAAERGPLILDWKAETRWGDIVTPNGKQRNLLELLVMEAKLDRGNPDRGFAVPVGVLQQHAATSNLDALLNRVRSKLGKESKKERAPAGKPPPPASERDPILRKRGAGVVALNLQWVRCDWFEVLAAEETFELTKDAYDRVHALSMAERAFVESARLTPPEVIAKAVKKPSEFGYLEWVVDKRWKLRQKYLQTLLEIDHTDTIVAEYRLWRDIARAGTRGFPIRGGCRDEFFGFNTHLVSPDGESLPALEALGRMVVGSRGKTLHKAVLDGPRRVARPERSALSRLQDDAKTAEAAGRLSRRNGPRGSLARMSIEWNDLDILVRELVLRLRKLDRKGFVPQVVIGLGRGGGLVAASVSEALRCRATGSISIDRYVYEGSEGSGEMHVRGADLPDRRACRVVVCDDVIAAGDTVREAIDSAVRPRYPKAEVIVCGLVLNRWGKERNKEAGEKWVGALEVDVDVDKGERVWFDFCWKTLDAPPGLKQSNEAAIVELDATDSDSPDKLGR